MILLSLSLSWSCMLNIIVETVRCCQCHCNHSSDDDLLTSVVHRIVLNFLLAGELCGHRTKTARHPKSLNSSVIGILIRVNRSVMLLLLVLSRLTVNTQGSLGNGTSVL